MSKGELLNQAAGRKRKGKDVFNGIQTPAYNITADQANLSEPFISPRTYRQQHSLSELATRASERRKQIKDAITDISRSSVQRSNSVVETLSEPPISMRTSIPICGYR